jgi:outer membrane protein assembly factor BamB
MNERTINLYTLIITSILSLIFLTWWILRDPVQHFSQHVPGADNRPETPAAATSSVQIGAYFESFNNSSVEFAGSWPRFRGADFDNISKDNIKLADTWDESGPNILWSVDLGEGHAGPVVSNGRVYLLDYDEENRREILRCFSFQDGKEIWRRGYDIYIKRNHGMSRTVPAISQNHVLTIGPKCHVMCVDADSGTYRWGMDLVNEYGSEVPLWYTGQCPLIEDSLAVIAVGGEALIIAVNCHTGEVVWETPNPDKWQMSHSSVIPMTIHGVRMYVYCALGGIIGVSADKESKGKVLFQSSAWNQTVIAPSPVYVGDGKIFITAGYGAGSIMIQVNRVGENFSVEVLQELKPEQGLASEQQTPIFYKNHLYAILPKDAGPLRNQFVCCHPDDFSKIVWSSGKTKRFGLGPFIVADDKFYILSDDGVLTVIETSSKEYIELAQVKVLNGHDAWGPLAIVNGRLLARDSRRMLCLDIRAHAL